MEQLSSSVEEVEKSLNIEIEETQHENFDTGDVEMDNDDEDEGGLFSDGSETEGDSIKLQMDKDDDSSSKNETSKINRFEQQERAKLQGIGQKRSLESTLPSNRLDETYEVINLWAKPRISIDRKFCPAKVPTSLHVEMSPFVESEEQRQQNQLDVNHTIRYRLQLDNNNEVITDSNGLPLHESNTKLIQWSDGSWTLAIGSTTYYECLFNQNDRSIIFDETNAGFLISHGMAKEKITLRPLSTTGGHLVGVSAARPRDNFGSRSKATQLTTANDAARADITNRKRLSDQRDQRAARARQKKMDARFLEEDPSAIQRKR